MKRCAVPKLNTERNLKFAPDDWTIIHATGGIFAVANESGTGKWSVTHVPTGLAVLWCGSKHDAYVKGWLLGQRIDKSIWSSKSVAKLRKHGSNELVKRMLSTSKWE